MNHGYRRDPDTAAVEATASGRRDGRILLFENQIRGCLAAHLSNLPGLGNGLAFRGL